LQDLLLKLLLAFLPIPFFFLIYINYFKRDAVWIDHLEAFFYGIFVAITLVALKVHFGEFYQKANPFLSGFLGAAIPEKGASFIAIYFLLKKRKNSLTVLQGMVMSMMYGLGFSSLENLIYAYASESSVILVRFFSAVPLHVYSNGIMGFYLSVSMLCVPSFKKQRNIIFAVALPLLLHGFFDSSLFSGGFRAFYIAPLIVIMNALVVYMLARSETLPGMKWLSDNRISYSDWTALESEPQYERWIMKSSGMKNREQVDFFRFDFKKRDLSIIILSAVVVLLIAPFHKLIYNLLFVNLSNEEQWTLLIGLPLSYIISAVSAGIVNPEYFKSSILKIPIIADVDFYVDKVKQNSITYEITDNNALLKTFDDFPLNTEVKLSFNFDKYFSPEINGKIIWDSHDDCTSSSGTIVRFNSLPDGFKTFLFRYYIFKISRGLSYNLKLPGFEGIRKFFIRPLTLMQKEQKFKAGTVLFEEGDVGKHFYLVKKGTVEIYKHLKNENRILLNTLKQGDIFGEMAIAGKQKRSASAVCSTDCVLAVADGENLEALIRGNSEFTIKIIQELAKRIYSSESIMKKGLSDMDSALFNSEMTFRAVLLAALHELKLTSVSRKGISIDKIPMFSLFKKSKIKMNPDEIEKILKGEISLRKYSNDFMSSGDNASEIYKLIAKIENKND